MRDELDYAARYIGGSLALAAILLAAVIVGLYVVFAALGAFVEVMTR